MLKNHHTSHDEKTIDENNHKNIGDILGLRKHICSNGIDPNNIPISTYLSIFANGPCSPVVLVPGIAGSKLIAKIQCEVLQKEHPGVFKSCGFNTCDIEKKDKGRWVYPQEEYKVWIPEIDSIMSIGKPFLNNQNCFANIMGLEVKQIKVENPISEGGFKLELSVSSLTGVKIYPLGSSPLTKTFSKGQCGFSAVENLLPVETILPTKFSYFKYLKDIFLNSGYLIGINLQVIPYDWRVGVDMNDFNQKFEKVIDGIFEIFQKKVVLIAHSMGNFQVINSL